MHCFEQKVLQGLKNCGLSLKENQTTPVKIGLGVSGGADSVSMLIALIQLKKIYPVELYVITVNHFIRPDEQTCHDASFVMDLCKKNQNYITKSYLCELKKGSVESLALKEKCGIEAAARELRYEAFDSFCNDNNLDYFCLAHNKNDQLETILMRILQGSFVENRSGIPMVRNPFIRPLIDITRDEIEQYLKDMNQDFCSDATNDELVYTRNKIRNQLVPLLNKEFSGWQTALLNGAKKDFLDGQFIINAVADAQKRLVKKNLTEDDVEIVISRKEFSELDLNIQIRLLLSQIDEVCSDKKSLRVPYVFLEDVTSFISKNKNQECTKAFSDIIIQIKKDNVFIKKGININTELYFSAIIEEDCYFDLPWANVEIHTISDSVRMVKINDCETQMSFNYPACIRTVCQEDCIETGDGKLKKVSHILTDWHVTQQDKSKILVIQDLTCSQQKLICILGRFCGFKDWILKN